MMYQRFDLDINNMDRLADYLTSNGYNFFRIDDEEVSVLLVLEDEVEYVKTICEDEGIEYFCN